MKALEGSAAYGCEQWECLWMTTNIIWLYGLYNPEGSPT